MAGEGFIQITFKIAGHQEINRKLATFGQDITDLSPAWEQVGTALLSDFARQFAMEGGTFGRASRWAPLARSTVWDRIRQGYGGYSPMLERTGQLRMSTSQRGTPGNIFDVQPMRLTVGTATPYAVFHQLSTRKMPARAIIGLTSQRLGFKGQSGSIVGMLNQYVQSRVRAAGLAAREL